MSFVITDQFSVRVIKINSRIGVKLPFRKEFLAHDRLDKLMYENSIF